MRRAAHPLPRSLLNAILVFLATVAGIYLLVLAALFFLQTWLLFPGSTSSTAALPPTFQHLVLPVGKGEQLRGVHIRPDRNERDNRPVILGFGGNAWNAAAVAATLHDLYPASHVVVFHFRGYPPSTGRPGAAALLHDAPLILDYVAENFPQRRIVAVGFSVGAAAAARLATDERLTGIILVTPFDSLRSVAQSHYPWVPVGFLLRHRLEPIEDLRQAKVPVAIIAAGHDEIVPGKNTQALARATATLVVNEVIAESGHNDVYGQPAFKEAMHKAFGRMQ